VGTQASSLVYALLTLALTGSSAKAGLVGFARLVPIGALSLLAGVAADRFDRKRIMVAADAVRGVTIGALAVSLAVGRPPFAAIVAAALVEGTGDTFFRPAAIGATRSVVPARQLADASSTTQARLATVRVVGPPLGGALYGIGRAIPFVFDALSYVGSLVTVLLMRTPFQEVRHAAPERIRAELRDGVRFLWSQHFLRTMALLLMVTNIVAAGVSLSIVVTGREQGLSGGQIGAIIAALGVSSLIGSLATPVIRRWLPGPRILLLELWTWVGTGVFVLWPDAYVLAVAILPCGFAIPNTDAVIGAYAMGIPPDRLVGRVNSTLMTIAIAAAPVGTLGAGVALDAAGARATVGALAGLALVLAIVGTLSPSIRTAPDLDRLDAVTTSR
jgi:predicted MFS family arabinose efflux permease